MKRTAFKVLLGEDKTSFDRHQFMSAVAFWKGCIWSLPMYTHRKNRVSALHKSTGVPIHRIYRLLEDLGIDLGES